MINEKSVDELNDERRSFFFDDDYFNENFLPDFFFHTKCTHMSQEFVVHFFLFYTSHISTLTFVDYW